MFTIYLYHKYEKLFSYTSSIVPQVGDIYTADEFEDGKQRKVIERILHPNPRSDNKELITITLDYSHPNLVPKKEEPKEILQTENY